MDPKPSDSSLSRSARSTALIMGITTISRLLGFVRQAAVNAIFGATGNADVLNAVFNIPNNLRKLLAEGALSSAFIPVLSQTSEDPQLVADGVPRHLVRNLLGFQYIVLIPVLILSAVFARPITGFILGFAEKERQELAAELFRWFIHYTLLISVSAVLLGTLNSRNSFAIPAITPIIFSVSVIASVLLLYRTLGYQAMSVGILIGGAAQIAIQAPRFVRLGFDFRPALDFRNIYFRRVLRQWLPVVAASSVFAVNQLVSFYFASGLESGSASALQNAVIFWQLPQGIFGVSIITVLFPRMSREATLDDRTALRHTLGFGVRAIVALLVPSAILLGLMGNEVVAVAFQRGNFTGADTVRTAQLLAAYCLGMASVVAFNFLQRFYYSYGNYRTPTWAAIVVVAIDVALSLWLKETELRVTGLAVANSVAFTVGAVALIVQSGRVVGGVDVGPIAATFAKTIAASLVPAAIIIGSHRVLGRWWSDGSTFANFGLLAAVGGVSLVALAGGFVIFRMEVVQLLVRRRIGRTKVKGDSNE